MTRQFVIPVVTGILLAVTPLSGPYAVDTPMVPDAPQYIIEMVVFQYLNPDQGGGMSASRRDELPADQQFDQPGSDPDLFPLPPSDFQLSAEANTLGRSTKYRLLLHRAWRQPLLDRERARPVSIDYPSESTSMLDGTVKVALGRYLHLTVDLVFRSNAALLAPVENDVYVEPNAALRASVWRAAQEFRLSETRRMRSGELHYIDHPQFGVLALIVPYQAAENTEKLNDTGSSAGPDATP